MTGVIAQALTMPPILPVYQANGDYTQIAQYYSDLGLNNQLRNPVANLLENRMIHGQFVPWLMPS